MINRLSQWRDGLKASGVSSKSKHAGLVIADWTWRTDLRVRFDVAGLSRAMSVSHRTAQYALRELQREGWLLVVQPSRQHAPPLYQLTTPKIPDDLCCCGREVGHAKTS